MKSRRKAGIGGFHAEYLNDRTALRQAKQMGFLRTIFSAASLLFGALMIYISLHYIPAFVQPREVIKFATGDSVALKTHNFDRNSVFGKVVAPYLDVFTMERAFIQPGQTVQVRYDLPKGAKMNVTIQQCRRLWVVEVFKCQLVSQQSLRIPDSRGKHTFRLKQGGFYHFSESVTLRDPSENYRVVWTRK